jgi:hypothetical protein
VIGQPWAEVALPPEQEHEHHAGDHGRYGERQVDQGNEQVLAAEIELRDRPTGADAEHQIQGDRDRSGDERQLQRGHRVRLAYRRDVSGRAIGKRLDEDSRQGQDEKKTKEQQGDSCQSPPNHRGLGEVARSVTALVACARVEGYSHRFLVSSRAAVSSSPATR